MSKKSMIGPVFAMDNSVRPVVAFANSATRPLASHLRQAAVMSPATPSNNGARAITLGLLAQPKTGGIK